MYDLTAREKPEGPDCPNLEFPFLLCFQGSGSPVRHQSLSQGLSTVSAYTECWASVPCQATDLFKQANHILAWKPGVPYPRGIAKPKPNRPWMVTLFPSAFLHVWA